MGKRMDDQPGQPQDDLWPVSEVGSPFFIEHPLLMGHDRGLHQFNAILERKQPSIVVVTGDAGAGKTDLLRAMEARASDKGWRTARLKVSEVGAVEQGWRTTRSDSQEALSTEQATDEDIFCAQVLTLLGVITDERFAQTQMDHSREHYSCHQLVQQLRQVPSLLLIDRYRPAPIFSSWFAGFFVKEVRHIEASVIVVIADRPEYIDKVKHLADEVISLDAPNSQALRQHFESIGQGLEPRMKSRELQHYIKAAHSDPAVLARLTRILTWMDKTSP
jgi:hypothetical protein